MPRCDFCGKPTTMPFHCQYCDGDFCDEHRLPPNHNCTGIEIWKKKPVPGVGIQYGRGGGAVPTGGGYAPERSGRKPKKPWGPEGIPYLKIAIAIIVIIFLLLLYLGLTGYFPGAEKTSAKSSGIPETVSIIPAPASTSIPEPALPVPLTTGNNPPPQTSRPTTLQTPVATPVKTTIPVTSATHVLTTAPTKIPTTDQTPPFPLATGPAPGNPYTVSTAGLASRVHELINTERTAQGLAALNSDPALDDIARKHSEDMAANNYFAHESLNGQTPTDRGTQAAYTCKKDYGSYYTIGIAENIFQNNLYTSVTSTNGVLSYDWTSPEDIAQSTVEGWMNSPGHTKNILTSTYDREGIGVAIASDDKVYITEDFC